MADSTRRRWHRLFGIGLTDLFAGTGWRVELEKELALKSQLLDVVVIERAAPDAAPPPELPDGLEALRAHNLLTYKSQHEALDAWALDELVGHYVNYRKLERVQRGEGEAAEHSDPDLVSTGIPEGGSSPDARSDRAAPHRTALLPERDFQLYAVATRDPSGLRRRADFKATGWEGVFDVRWGARNIRLIVLSLIAPHPRNAPWEPFSADLERIRHGAQHFSARSPEALDLLYELYLRYTLELPNMPYTLADFRREHRELVMSELTPEEILKLARRLPPEDRLRDLPPEERLRGLPPEERLRGLPPEERLSGLSPEDVLRGLPPDERRRLEDLVRKDRE